MNTSVALPAFTPSVLLGFFCSSWLHRKLHAKKDGSGAATARTPIAIMEWHWNGEPRSQVGVCQLCPVARIWRHQQQNKRCLAIYHRHFKPHHCHCVYAAFCTSRLLTPPRAYSRCTQLCVEILVSTSGSSFGDTLHTATVCLSGHRKDCHGRMVAVRPGKLCHLPEHYTIICSVGHKLSWLISKNRSICNRAYLQFLAEIFRGLPLAVTCGAANQS
ncbi:hypothetical protein B0H10DRAFT_664654 [Mycena sp. CBHHK59/15]|nr:hypothetical protein B0H10DRAFT_664654 [Mycena sp. CBHHK59/15]